MNENKSYEMFDIVSCDVSNLALILSKEMEVPYYEDGIASSFAWIPLDIQNPNEWKKSFNGYICFDLNKNEYFVLNKERVKFQYEGNPECGQFAIDAATTNSRLVLGLRELAKKWWKSEPTNR